MPDNDVIHIALAFCDPKGTYARHAAVTMASIFANSHDRRICVHILHDATLTHDNLFALTELAEKYHQNVAFTDVEKCFEELQNKAKDLPLGGYRGTMFRLFISDVLDVEKVIYLDCDIVVELDIAELWNIHLNGNTVAAVRDVWTLDYLKGKKVPWRLGKVWDLLGVSHDSYFNAGVMVLDLKNIRTKYCLTDKVVEFYSRYRKCITLHDQDFLNWVFAGDVRLIDERFNHINLPSEKEKNIYGSIWHMAGGSAKPWNSYSRPYIDDLYWKYLRLTPYCKDDDEFLHLLLMGMGSSPLMHLHSSSCFSRLFKQLKDNVFRAHIWTILPILWQHFKRRLGFVLNRRERYD